MADHNDGRPKWDEEVALDLMDSIVLVGITRLTHDEQFIGQEQLFGRVVVANERDGICLKLEGVREGEHYWLPPTTENYERAKPGVYTLRSTGEDVHDPDFLTTWVMTEPSPDEKRGDDTSETTVQ
ncbi:MAG TPA: hypothetical protein VFV70_12205 [Hyphomonadaceae bacterium]|nr:hypothetical protein [Hyphomonadaceae bacterium]